MTNSSNRDEADYTMPDSPLRSTTDVPPLLSESINQVRRGQLEPRSTSGIR